MIAAAALITRPVNAIPSATAVDASRRRTHSSRTLKEFGFGLAAAVFLDALVVRCVMLPAVLELLGPVTWRLPRWLDRRLPHINIEGASARAPRDAIGDPEAEPAPA